MRPPLGLVLATRPAAGRSGYLHRRPDCWARFAARKGPVRSLGCHVDKAARQAFVRTLHATPPLSE